METVCEDTCVWCNHPLEVFVQTWKTVKSTHSMPLVANYCTEKTCRTCNAAGVGKDFSCETEALDSDESTERVLQEILNRRKLVGIVE